ncbi:MULTISPECIES: hypothetical protein [unclassified Streptomyces]|uniref:hypothetical protein n=1 Tax=unclassified Streptomyces TaxID=2593676 RepID=UPI003D8CE38D
MVLAYVSLRGRALIDRELHLPKSGTGASTLSPGREAVRFATVPELAQRMPDRLFGIRPAIA